jgi:hypothetical protein
MFSPIYCFIEYLRALRSSCPPFAGRVKTKKKKKKEEEEEE